MANNDDSMSILADFTEAERAQVADVLHERQSAGISSGATSADAGGASDDDSYHGPLVI